MRENGALFWLLSDHLGSTAITADEGGAKVSELRYKAWGERRYTWGTTPTDRRYTGQIEHAELGLYFYNARWYDPALGRFVQADTIVPGAGNPLAWDRYAYTNNNPLRYTDPAGHEPQLPMIEGLWGNPRAYRHEPQLHPRAVSEAVLVGAGLEKLRLRDSETAEPALELSGDGRTGHEAYCGSGYADAQACGGTQLPDYGAQLELVDPKITYEGTWDPFVGMGIDFLGVVADVELLLTGDPTLSSYATYIEAGWVAYRATSGNPLDAQLFMEQQLADTSAGVPAYGMVYSVWGIVLNIKEIVDGFSITTRATRSHK